MLIEEISPGLCCCEYIDESGIRNHILACCCDCQNLDEGFECIVTGQPVTEHRKSAIIATMFDRLRLPWIGGAKRIAPDVTFAVFSLLGLILLASINVNCTIICSFLLSILFFYVHNNAAALPNFFFTCTVTSIILIYLIFEFITVPFLQILLEENVALTVLLLAFIYCAYTVRSKANCGRNLPNNASHQCRLCKAEYSNQLGSHQYWINSCVTPRNIYCYLLTLIFAIVSLLYSANLTLTTICRPFVFYKHILLPADCSDAYAIIDLSLPFVIALYSILVSFILFIKLCYYLWIIIMGSKRKCICYSIINKMKNTCLCFK